MLSGLEARASVNIPAQMSGYKERREKLISSLNFSTLTDAFRLSIIVSSFGQSYQLSWTFHPVSHGALRWNELREWVHRELEWLSDPIWSHIRVLVTLWPFMPILMWFVVIPEPVVLPTSVLLWSYQNPLASLSVPRCHCQTSWYSEHLCHHKIPRRKRREELSWPRDTHCCAAPLVPKFPGP